jgi:hypothetical protein
MNIHVSKKERFEDMAIFSNKIHCGNCENVFHPNNERGKTYWSCQGDEKCGINIVSEDAMIEFISRRLWIDDRTKEKITQLVERSVEKIVVKDKNNFDVFFRGQESMSWKPGHIHY